MFLNENLGNHISYQWEQEVIECSVSVPSFWLGDTVIILSWEPASEGSVGRSETRVISESEQEMLTDENSS